MRTLTLTIISSDELDKLTGDGFDFVAENECVNDSTHLFEVINDCSGSESKTRKVLEKLYKSGVIVTSSVLVDVCW